MESLEPYLQTARELWTSGERRWLVSFRSPLEIWSENPTFLAVELVTYCWAFLSLKHGKNVNRRPTYMRMYVTPGPGESKHDQQNKTLPLLYASKLGSMRKRMFTDVHVLKSPPYPISGVARNYQKVPHPVSYIRSGR